MEEKRIELGGSSSSSSSSMTVKIYIVYYSLYGHVETLANEIKKGADSVQGVESKIWEIPEMLTIDGLSDLKAINRVWSVVPKIAPKELLEADGFVFGFPTRFGMVPAQFIDFMDQTGELLKSNELAGKPAGMFFSTSSQGGGQETTAHTAIPLLVHHGMLIVPTGYKFGAGMFEMEQVKGGSPYGAGTYGGSPLEPPREPTVIELGQAFYQGKYIATIAKKLKEAA